MDFILKEIEYESIYLIAYPANVSGFYKKFGFTIINFFQAPQQIQTRIDHLRSKLNAEKNDFAIMHKLAGLDL